MDIASAALARPELRDDPAKKNAKESTAAGDILDGASGAIDAVDLGVVACKAFAKAVQPAHLTGGKDLPAGFTTGGGDSVVNAFETAAECAPDAVFAVADAAGDGLGLLEVIGGVFEGLGSL
jgi:hypothetical protein